MNWYHPLDPIYIIVFITFHILFVSDIIMGVVVFAIMDNTIIYSVNCEGLNRISVFLSSVLKIYKCDLLCLQELRIFG